MARTEEQWITIISQLLKKAEKTDSEAEASTFFAQANELMVRHAIDAARVRDEQRATTGGQVEEPVQVYWMWATNDAHAKAKAVLVEQAARSQHVVFTNFPNKPNSNIFREGNKGRYSQWGSFVGYAQDIENAKIMFTSLLIQWTRFVRQDVQAPRGGSFWETGTGDYGFKTGHLEGFAYRVGERLHKQERDILEAANASALMVNKDVAISDWLKAKHGPVPEYCFAIQPTEQFAPRQRKALWCIRRKGHDPVEGTVDGHAYTWKVVYSSSGSRTREVNSSGYYAGQAAGSRADITRPSTKIGG